MPSSIIKQISEILPETVHSVELPIELKKYFDLLLKTQSGLAFFSIMDKEKNITQTWRMLQDEISAYLSQLRKDGKYNGAYLTLLVNSSNQTDVLSLQRIAANPYVCRKIIVPSFESKSVSQIIENLPFFPLPNRIKAQISRPPIDPFIVSKNSGFSSDLVEKLLKRVSPNTIKEQLLSGNFDTPTFSTKADTPDKEVAVTNIDEKFYLRGVKINGFRNYGNS
jgi:hypothetical protein